RGRGRMRRGRSLHGWCRRTRRGRLLHGSRGRTTDVLLLRGRRTPLIAATGAVGSGNLLPLPVHQALGLRAGAAVHITLAVAEVVGTTTRSALRGVHRAPPGALRTRTRYPRRRDPIGLAAGVQVAGRAAHTAIGGSGAARAAGVQGTAVPVITVVGVHHGRVVAVRAAPPPAPVVV